MITPNLFSKNCFPIFTAIFYSLLTSAFLLVVSPLAAQSVTPTSLGSIDVRQNTGKKPMSQVWKNDGKWFAALAANGGSYIYRLDGSSWTQLRKLDNDKDVFIDAKSVGDTVHILLFEDDDNDIDLVSVEYNHATNEYDLWSERSSKTSLSLGSGGENEVQAPTIDIDSEGRMWVGYKYQTNASVRYSDHPYSAWSSQINVETSVHNKDLACLVAFSDNDGDKIGLMWSNRNDERFGFSYHNDGANPSTWSTDEVPGDAYGDSVFQAEGNVGLGMSDDHINMAVASDGTLYAAVKTSYDESGFPQVGLMVRRPNGVWDNFYEIDDEGSKPIVLLNEALNELLYVYTYPSQLEQIAYRTIPLATLGSPSARTILFGGSGHGFSSSTKDRWTGDVVVLVYDDDDNEVDATQMNDNTTFPIELTGFDLNQVGASLVLDWVTAWETNSHRFSIERSFDGESFESIGALAAKGNSFEPSNYTWTDESPKVGYNYYRLKMEDLDGTFTYSSILVHHIRTELGGKQFVIAPNPAKDRISLYFDTEVLDKNGPLSVRIYNSWGQLVQESIPVEDGAGVSLRLKDTLTDGIYIVKLYASGKSYNNRLIIQSKY